MRGRLTSSSSSQPELEGASLMIRHVVMKIRIDGSTSLPFGPPIKAMTSLCVLFMPAVAQPLGDFLQVLGACTGWGEDVCVAVCVCVCVCVCECVCVCVCVHMDIRVHAWRVRMFAHRCSGRALDKTRRWRRWR